MVGRTNIKRSWYLLHNLEPRAAQNIYKFLIAVIEIDEDHYNYEDLFNIRRVGE